MTLNEPREAMTKRFESDICLSCGLCCDGTWFDHAPVGAEELNLVESLGLSVIRVADNKLVFRLACHLHQQGHCSIYDRKRPAVCSAFQCKLLRRYLVGDIARDEALRLVVQAKNMLTLLRQRSRFQSGYRQWLRQISDRPEKLAVTRENANWMIVAVALLTTYRRHFKNAPDTDDHIKQS